MCSQDLKVYYISGSYPGRNPDATISNHVLELWCEDWEEEEFVLADQGFTSYNPRIIIPINYDDATAKKLRSVRCRVENCIALFKRFAICRLPLKEKVNHPDGCNILLAFHQKMWLIVVLSLQVENVGGNLWKGDSCA